MLVLLTELLGILVSYLSMLLGLGRILVIFYVMLSLVSLGLTMGMG
jgi:hypothetical protein